MLLEGEGVDHGKPENSGFERVAELVLGGEDLDPGCPDNQGPTLPICSCGEIYK